MIGNGFILQYAIFNIKVSKKSGEILYFSFINLYSGVFSMFRDRYHQSAGQSAELCRYTGVDRYCLRRSSIRKN